MFFSQAGYFGADIEADQAMKEAEHMQSDEQGYQKQKRL